MNPGEYLAPLPRKMQVCCPVVSGYVTARLRQQDQIPPVTSGAISNMMVTFENVGNTAFSVVLNETNDRSVSGTRSRITGFTGTAAYVVPGGHQVVNCQSKATFLEVYCTGTTTGNLRMQIESNRRWTQCGFDKLDTYYPTSLYWAKETPGPLT